MGKKRVTHEFHEHLKIRRKNNICREAVGNYSPIPKQKTFRFKVLLCSRCGQRTDFEKVYFGQIVGQEHLTCNLVTWWPLCHI